MKKVADYSKYDCELVDVEMLKYQNLEYLIAENYQPFVSDEDIIYK